MFMHFPQCAHLMSKKAPSDTEQGGVMCAVSPHLSAPAPPESSSCSCPGETLTLSNGISCQAVLFEV